MKLFRFPNNYVCNYYDNCITLISTRFYVMGFDLAQFDDNKNVESLLKHLNQFRMEYFKMLQLFEFL